MSRYLIIDTYLTKGDPETVKYEQALNHEGELLGYVLSEEETLSKFKEVWEAGKKFGYIQDKEDMWQYFSKTL